MQDKYSQYLRCYQRQGIERLKFFNGKAIQADDMGLGKTLQILAYAYETDSFPCLVVAPSSLVLNWKAEIKKWLDCDDVYIVKTRLGAETVAREALEHKFIIMSYDVALWWVRPFIDMYFEKRPKLVIFDEAHLLKADIRGRIDKPKIVAGYHIYGNERVTAAQYLCEICDKKIFATGTPVSNGAMDVFNFLHFIDAEHFLLPSRFGEKYAYPVWDYRTQMNDYRGGKNLFELNKLLRDCFMVRRLKKDVLKELPEKNRVFLPIDVKSHIRQDYENHRGNDLAHRMEMRKALIPAVTEAAIDFIESYGKKIVVYAVFHETIDILKAHFGDRAVVYDGRMSQKQKYEAEQAFQKDEKIKVFIGNVQAAGKGITLTAADTCLTLEFTDNPTDLTQTEDRINRIGQVSDVTTNYYMFCEGTIDEDLVKNMNDKMEIITQAVDGYVAQEADLFNADTVKVKEKSEFLFMCLLMMFLPIVVIAGLIINQKKVLTKDEESIINNIMQEVNL